MDKTTETIIGCGIEVHRALGPGLLESAYEVCMAYEMRTRNLEFLAQYPIPVQYKGVKLDCGYRIDFLVAGQVVVELKAKQALTAIDEAQLLSYLRLLRKPVGLLMNFHENTLVAGVNRMVNDYPE